MKLEQREFRDALIYMFEHRLEFVTDEMLADQVIALISFRLGLK